MSEYTTANDVCFHRREKDYVVDFFDYVVDFFGGPLDGASVVTDVCPNANRFTHRAFGRQFVYRYTQREDNRFEAQFEGPLRVEHRVAEAVRPKWFLPILAVCLLLAILVWFIVAR